MVQTNFKDYRLALGGWTQKQAADALGITLKTYRRYESGAFKRLPFAAKRLLAILAAGDLGAIHPRWEGWRMVDGELYSPENQPFEPGDLRAAQYMRELVKEIERKNGGVLPVMTRCEQLCNESRGASNVIDGHFPISPNQWFSSITIDESIDLLKRNPQQLIQFINMKFRVSRSLDGEYGHWPIGTEAQIVCIEFTWEWGVRIEKLDLYYDWPEQIDPNPLIGLGKLFSSTVPL